MVARERLSAIVFTLMILGSGLVSLMPFAEATHSVGTPTVWLETNRNNQRVHNASVGTLIAGSPVWINVSWSVISPPATCTSVTATATATANLQRFGAGMTASQALTVNGNKDGASIQFTITAGSSTLTNDQVSVNIAYTCPNDGSAVQASGTSQQYNLDTSPPTLSNLDRDNAAAGVKKIGDTFTLTLASPTDFSNFTIDVSQVNGGSFTAGALAFTNGVHQGTGAPPTSIAGITITDTGVEDPQVFVGGGDVNGNTIRFATPTGRFDAQRPPLAMVGFVPQLDGRLNLSVPIAPAGDITHYAAVVTPTGSTGGAQVSTICPLSREVGSTLCWRSENLHFLINNTAGAAFASNGTYNVTFHAIDDANNPSITHAKDVAVPSADPYFASITSSLVGQAFQTFSGIVSDWQPQIQVNVTIKNAGGNYWDETLNSGAGGFTSGTYKDYVVMPTGNTWRYPAVGAGASALPPASSAEGSYDVRYCAFHPSGKANCFTSVYKLDKTGPVYNLTPANNRMESPGSAIGAPAGTAVIRLGVNDTLGGIRTINITLLDPVTEQPAVGKNGGPIIATCEGASTANCTLSPPLATSPTAPTANYGVGGASCAGPCHANATVSFPNAFLGTYKLNITATDWAGNTNRLFVGAESAASSAGRDTIIVGPRVTIPPTLARVNANRLVTVTSYAAWDNATSFDPLQNPCPESTCRVTEVQFEVRQSSGSTASNLGEPIRLPGPEGVLTSGGLKYYNYSTSGTVAFDPANAEVRAIARVVRGPGQAAISTPSPWTRLTPENVQATPITFTVPKANGTYTYLPSVVYDDNKTTYPSGSPVLLATPHAPYNRTIPVRLTYDEAGLAAAPTLRYVVKNSTTGAILPFNRTQHSGVDIDVVPVTAQVGGRYYFNWSNNQQLPLGNYTLFGNISRTSGPDVPFQQNFSVETRLPFVQLNATNPEIFGGSYVASRFNVSFVVDSGLAAFNGTSHSYNLTLRNNSRYLVQGTEWTSTLKRVAWNPVGNNTTLDFEVTLPGTLVDGSLNELRLNVTTESYNACRCPQDAASNNSTTLILSYDGLPGNGTVLSESTRLASLDRARPLSIFGFAQDTGSGIREVQVRIVNLSMSGNGTYNVSENRFVPGIQEMWVSSKGNAISDIRLAKRMNVTYPLGGRPVGVADILTWELGNTQLNGTTMTGTPFGTLDPMPLDRASTYRVDVRIVDNVTRVSAWNSTLVSFDPTPPVLDKPSFVGPAFADWHGGGFFRIFASDNNCLARVSLVGRSPTNATVGPENFEVPAGANCWQSSASSSHAWTFDLSLHPNFTSEIGRYEVWVEAADPAGNLANSSPRTVNYTVNDTLAAVVRNISFAPDPAQAGSTTRVTIKVFENHLLDRVEVDILSANGTVLKNTSLGSLGGNGTGDYVVETGAGGLGLALEVGTYTVRARAIDVAHANKCTPTLCPYVSATLTVTAEGAPQVLLDSPSNNTHVNATPEIRFRALGRGVEGANVTVLAGNSTANMTAVNATFTAIPGTGATAGVNGVYRPTGLKTGEELHVRVDVSKGGALSSATWKFPVDASAPNATMNVTGTVTLDNRTWVGSATKVFINATDDVSAVTITYTTSNGARTSAEATYAGAITPAPAANDTEWRLSWTARDAAGNAVRGNLTLAVDKLGPTVTVAQHGDDLLLTVTETGSGLDGGVTVYYSYGLPGAYESIVAKPLTGNSYEAHLPGNASATGLRYYFVAKDRLGNIGGFGNHTATNPYVILAEGKKEVDLPPTIRIDAPAPGAIVRDAIELRWTASDPEGDPLTFTIATTQPREVVIASGLENVSTYRHNLTAADSGTWKIIVTVSDGTNSASASVTFTVPAGETVRIVNNPPVTVQPGQFVPFSVAIVTPGKSVEKATFVVQDSTGRNVNTGTLTQSRAGVYSGQGLVTRPGEYRVLVDVLYADGSTEPRKDVGTFSVAQPNAPIAEAWPLSTQLIALLGPITILLAAAGAFWRWRK